MKNKLIVLVISSFFLGTSLVQPIKAQEPTPSAYESLRVALDSEVDGIYKPYAELVDRLSDESTAEVAGSEFVTNLFTWRSIYQNTEKIYRTYQVSSDPQIVEVANRALLSNQKGQTSIEQYLLGINSEDDGSSQSFMDQGDVSFQEAIKYHDEAIDLYNNYSGASSDASTRDILIALSVIGLIATFILFLKSRNSSLIEADIVKSEIYKRLTKSSLWMTIGLGVTAGGLAYAIENGGTYYILYGPVLFGAWELLKGLARYFKNDRKVLAELATNQRQDAIRASFLANEEKEMKEWGKCPKCGEKLIKKSIVCSSCGENIL